MLNYEPTLPLHPPPRAIPAVVFRAYYTLPGGLVIIVVVHQRRHCCHHGVGCCLVPPTATVILTIVVHRQRNPTNNGVPAASPHPHPPCNPPPPIAVAPSPPSQSPMAPLWTGMRRQFPLSSSDAASAAPARAPLIGIRAKCASAAVTNAAMPWSP
jgi:hypothetical protein